MTDGNDPLDAIRARFLHRLAEQRLSLSRLSDSPGNSIEILQIVHKIAGIAGSLGFPELSRAAGAVEMQLVQKQAIGLRTSEEWERLTSLIEATLDESSM